MMGFMRMTLAALVATLVAVCLPKAWRRWSWHVYQRGLEDGAAEGYQAACDRIFLAVQGTSDLAYLSESMGTPMDTWTFTVLLAERLAVSLNAEVELVVCCEGGDEP